MIRVALIAPFLTGALGGSGALMAAGTVVLAYALVVLRPVQAVPLAGARPSRNEI